MKYTEQMLREAVAASLTMADVLRQLGVPLNGGAHAHLRRRITALGIDTSHFLGRAHYRGRVSRRRLSAAEVLVARAADRRRADPATLRRALMEIGRRYACALCGVDGTWNGRRITLHVDHISGAFWDCRPDNLRLLCPNCHSQTATYAGRNRRVHAVATAVGGEPGRPAHPAPRPDEAEVIRILARVDGGQLTVTAAAGLIGCHRNHVYRIRRRLLESGSIAAPPRPTRRVRFHEAVVAYALAHPELGAKSISRRLRDRQGDRVVVSHGTVATILAEVGLATRAARRAAVALEAPRSRIGSPAGVAEWQTRQI